MALVVFADIRKRRIARAFGVIYGIFAGPLVAVFSKSLGLQSVLEIVVGLLCVFVPITCYCVFHKRNLKRAVERAPSLRDWILRNFAELDADGDGVITRADIYAFRATVGRNDADRKNASRTAYELCVIGHVIDTVTGFAIMMDGTGTGGVVAVNLYGISPADAESYPARIAQTYEAEFGSQ